MARRKACEGCGKLLYAVNNRCVLCDHLHSTFAARGRTSLTKGGALRQADREGRGPGVRSAVERRTVRAERDKEKRVRAARALEETYAPPTTGSWQAAEVEARDWMRTHGWPEAERTRSGADGGVDVRAVGSPPAVAQVKLWRAAVGIGDVQRLFACAVEEGARPLFFSGGGYTRAAAEWADKNGVARFSLGPIVPRNSHAETVAREQAQGPATAKVTGNAKPSGLTGRMLRTTLKQFPELSAHDLESAAACEARIKVLRGGRPWSTAEARRRERADRRAEKLEGRTVANPALRRNERLSRLQTEVKAARSRP